MQLQADVLGMPIERCAVPETTALGAAYLAGLSSGFWSDLEEISNLWAADVKYEPGITASEREESYAQWSRAVERARNWAVPD